MRQAMIILGLLIGLTGCKKDTDISPGEVEAMITGEVVIDNWGKGCSAGGLAITIGNEHYFISNSVLAEYHNANAWPISVWVRYELAPPDSCVQQTNRITVLSIRKR